MTMRLTVHEFLTLDGVMQGPGGPDEDTTGGFTQGGWMVPFGDEDFGTIVDSWFARTGAFLLGRTTYDMMQEYWSRITDPDNAVAVALNTLRKYVVTSSGTTAQWANTEPIPAVGEADVVEAVRALRGGPGQGELQVHGSHRLARSLHIAGLVDTYRLITFPVLVGAGKRLFEPGDHPTALTVLETRITSTGGVYQVLEPSAAAPARAEYVVGEDGKESVRWE
ncbi:dihydrofolate reductase family protein [Occultella kanbiaonis]|uniref:dihydrofolate reductase family protein n=1 Tax=Occultella kanbiaonis TaxID=2675754 RepID=UPI001E5AA0D7|nr:dihydrofolate reductase family protein [Occultella kanbiaonis]